MKVIIAKHDCAIILDGMYYVALRIFECSHMEEYINA
jgi:hypothetical protein